MNRRKFLHRTGILGALALAGCTSQDDTGTDPENGSDGSDGGTGSTPPTSTPDGISVVDSSVNTTRTMCASDEAEAVDISIDDSEQVVSFTGRMQASTPCHDVIAESTSYDADDDTLSIVLGTDRRDEACVDCVGELVFEGTVTLEGGLPGDVTVLRADTVLGSTRSDIETPTPPPQSPSLVDSSFTVTNVGPGVETNDTDISFERDSNVVVVTGTIPGSDGCKTAKLDSAAYDDATDTLTVSVVTTDREGTEDKACTQSIIEIDYEARFTFEGGLPTVASISHDGQGIASAAHGTASAGEADGK